jgi:hypothetical protein
MNWLQPLAVSVTALFAASAVFAALASAKKLRDSFEIRAEEAAKDEPKGEPKTRHHAAR